MSVGSLKVKIFDAKGTHAVPVSKSTVTVGSASHCDVVLEHDSIQAEHVRAWLDGGRIWIQDMGTTGGTFLNGIRLPPLKPMLVRELDVLKLGESPATLGMEANLVRAPVVKAAPAVEENTPIEIRTLTPQDHDLEKRREDLAKVSRELAELRLQLQMGRLEKTSGEEVRKQLNQSREEMRQLGDQREQLNQALHNMTQERDSRLKAADEEIARKMAAAENEIKAMRALATRKLEHWKVDLVAELSRHANLLTTRLSKDWGDRTVSSDMVLEWQSQLNQMFREVLLMEDTQSRVAEITNSQFKYQLGEKSSVTNTEHTLHPLVALPPSLMSDDGMPAPPIGKSESVKLPPSPPPSNASSSPSAAAPTTKTRLPRDKRAEREANAGGKAGLAVAGLAAIGIFLWIAKPFGRLGTSRSVASQPGSTVVPAPPPTSSPTAATATSTSVPARYSPRQTKIFKKTYTENVLYTENYAAAEFNQTFHQRWMADLSKAGRDEWHVDDKTLFTVAAKELQLIQDLQKMKDGIQVSREQQGIAAMRARENAFQSELTTLLHSPQVVERYHRLKNSFYTKNQQYLTKR